MTVFAPCRFSIVSEQSPILIITCTGIFQDLTVICSTAFLIVRGNQIGIQHRTFNNRSQKSTVLYVGNHYGMFCEFPVIINNPYL
jgi:hypothetical protein